MTKTVITEHPDTTVAQAAELTIQNRVSAIPVLDKNGGIVGIVSEGDLLRRVEGAQESARSWWLSPFSESRSSARGFIQVRGLDLSRFDAAREWPLHCHNAYHLAAGMMTTLTYV